MKTESSMPKELKSAQTGGYIHGISTAALPDEYYKRMLEAPVPSITFNANQEEMHLYLPATAEMSNKHLLFDTKDNLIKKRMGYDVLNHLNNVKPETSIVEADLND
uniref:Uncharacterized protein n=1 Tax=Romanomermis culicivorax TaxID=13658 RepID=A0A915JFK1_ROMCU